MASSVSAHRVAAAGMALCAAALAAAARPAAPEQPVVLYPAARTVHSRAVRIILATRRDSAPPVCTLDGRQLRLQQIAVDPSWLSPSLLKGTSARLGERADHTVWAAMAPTGKRPARLMVDGASVGWDWSRTPGETWSRSGNDNWTRADGTTWSRVSGEAWTRSADGGWARAGGNDGWGRASDHPDLSPHPGEPDCAICHGGKQGLLSAAATPRACAACHPEASVQLIHKHVAEPLARCAMCHDPHGAPFPKLLVAPRDKLCSQCHALGHSKG